MTGNSIDASLKTATKSARTPRNDECMYVLSGALLSVPNVVARHISNPHSYYALSGTICLQDSAIQSEEETLIRTLYIAHRQAHVSKGKNMPRSKF